MSGDKLMTHRASESLNVLQCIAVYDACDTDMAPGVTTQWSVMQIYGNEKGHYYECLLFISVKNS